VDALPGTARRIGVDVLIVDDWFETDALTVRLQEYGRVAVLF